VIDRYFVIMSIGHSGSAWLAKLLNSHFDVMCFHELECVTYGEGMPPRIRAYNEFSREELLRNLMYLFSPTHRYGDSYKVMGTVDGAIDIETMLTQISTTFPEAHAKTHYYMLLRNPISQVHSNAQGNLKMPPVLRQRLLADNFRSITAVLSELELPLRAALQSHLQLGDDDTQFFLYACLGYLRVLWSARKLTERVANAPLLQLERLTQEPDYLRATLKDITGLDYAVDAQSLEKVNVKSGARPPQAVWDSWSADRQRLFRMVFDRFPDLLQMAGYQLDSLIPTSGSIATDRPATEPLPVPTLDDLHNRWTSTDIALRDTRVQLAKATEALSELRQQYDESSRRAALAEGLGPRSLMLARGVRRFGMVCRRIGGGFRSLIGAPKKLPQTAPDDTPQSRRAA
jgi:hypothetical protein